MSGPQPNVTALAVPAAARNDAAFVSATTAPPTLVFKPGAVFSNNGPVQQNVFTTGNSSGVDGLTLLQNTLAGVGLSPAVPLPSSVVQIDTSVSDWNLFAAVNFGKNCTLDGLGADGAPGVLSGFPGSSIRGANRFSNLVIVTLNPASFVADTPTELIFFRCNILSNGGPFYTTSSDTSIFADNTSFVNIGSPVFNVGAGHSLTMNVSAIQLGANCFSLGLGSSITINVTDGDISLIDKTLFTTAGITIKYTTSPVNITTTGTSVLSPPNSNFTSNVTTGSQTWTLPAVANLPDGWIVKTTLTTVAAMNTLTIAVDGGSSESLNNPSTGASGSFCVLTAPNQSVTWQWNKTANEWMSSGSAMLALPVLTPADNYTLISYEFNQKAINPGLINKGTWGVSAFLGTSPIPVTFTGFTQPNVGSTVTVGVSSLINYQAGNLIAVPGGGYYYCTATGAGTLTLQNLGIAYNGTLAAPASGVAGGTLKAVLDLLNTNANGVSLIQPGVTGWATQFLGNQGGGGTSSISNYNVGGSGGGIGQFTGQTAFTMSLLLCPQPNPGYGANFFGFAHSQSWGVGFRDVGLILDNTANNRWGLSFTNQSVTPTTGIYSYYPSGNTSWLTPNQWQLISVTVDCTMTVGAINFYKNGLYVGSADLTYTGTLTLGSSGYWYVGNPSPGGGDTGDGYLGLMGMARFETVVRSPSYLLSLAQSLFPNQTNW